MRFLSKIFLFLVISSNNLVSANFYSVCNFIQKGSLYLRGMSKPALTLKQYWTESNQIESLPDASQEVFDFCKNCCEKQKVDVQALKVRIKEDNSVIAQAVGKQNIVFGRVAHDELQKALQNPSDEVSNKIILVYTFLIDHEIGHLKGHDGIKRMSFVVGSNLLVCAGAYYVMNNSSLKSWFKTSTNFKEFIVSILAYNGVSLLFLANDFAEGLYVQNQEISADNNAIKYANDPESLRLAANYFETLDDGCIDMLCGAQINPSIPSAVKMQIENIRAALVAQYEAEEVAEDFRGWVKKQTGYLTYLKFIADKKHPSGVVRASKMRAAADDLERAFVSN